MRDIKLIVNKIKEIYHKEVAWIEQDEETPDWNEFDSQDKQEWFTDSLFTSEIHWASTLSPYARLGLSFEDSGNWCAKPFIYNHPEDKEDDRLVYSVCDNWCSFVSELSFFASNESWFRVEHEIQRYLDHIDNHESCLDKLEYFPA